MNSTYHTSILETGDNGENSRSTKIIEAFLEKTLWLCEKFPGIGHRSQVATWLVYCLLKNGDSDQSRQEKSKAVKIILDFFKLRQREFFEAKLINFVKTFSQCAPLRSREYSSHIESGTDWGRSYQKSLIESAGRLSSFVNYNRKYEFDFATKSSLLLLVWNMGHELENLSKQIKNIDEKIAESFQQRANVLISLCKGTIHLPMRYYTEHTDHALRRTQPGRAIAEEIIKWVFNPEWEFKRELQNQGQSSVKNGLKTATQLLQNLVKDGNINENDLFEIIATVNSICALTNNGFNIVSCDISEDKPVVKLQRGDLFCQVRKSFEQEVRKHDKLIHYRTIGNSDPTGFQPDIVYKFWRGREIPGCKRVYLLGDAKNYERPTTNALYDMMRYLIAFREELDIENDIIPCLDCSLNSHKRIVLFFSTPQQSNGCEKYPQPGRDKKHPVLFVYGTNDENGNIESLKTFFEDAIKSLTNEV